MFFTMTNTNTKMTNEIDTNKNTNIDTIKNAQIIDDNSIIAKYAKLHNINIDDVTKLLSINSKNIDTKKLHTKMFDTIQINDKITFSNVNYLINDDFLQYVFFDDKSMYFVQNSNKKIHKFDINNTYKFTIK